MHDFYCPACGYYLFSIEQRGPVVRAICKSCHKNHVIETAKPSAPSRRERKLSLTAA